MLFGDARNTQRIRNKGLQIRYTIYLLAIFWQLLVQQLKRAIVSDSSYVFLASSGGICIHMLVFVFLVYLETTRLRAERGRGRDRSSADEFKIRERDGV